MTSDAYGWAKTDLTGPVHLYVVGTRKSLCGRGVAAVTRPMADCPTAKLCPTCLRAFEAAGGAFGVSVPPAAGHNAGARCMAPACDRAAKTRGLCRRCYGAAGVLVRAGQATWEGLEARGLVLPRHPRCQVSPFLAAYLATPEGHADAS